MTEEKFVALAEAFVDKHGRSEWWWLMDAFDVDTLAGAIENRELMAIFLTD